MNYRFNEFSQQSIDFTDEELVAKYDSKQKASIENEVKLVQDLGISLENHVIEFGPGTGALSIAMAKACQHVYAVDTSKAMLAYIEKSSQDYKIENISTHHAGFLSYEHKESPVDLVVTKYAFHHLPDMWKGVTLTRINKMLKQGGRFYLEDVIFSFEIENYESAIDSWIDNITQNSGWSREDFEVHVNEEYT